MLKNTETEYGNVTKALHWTIAVLVITLLCLGLIMDDVKDMSLKLAAFNLHKSLGITVLALMVARLVWHIISRRPKPVPTIKPWEKQLSWVVHNILYLLLVAMPVTGWLMSSAKGRSVKVFGLGPLPDLVPKDVEAGKIYAERHEQIAWVIAAVLALHIGGAFKHLLVDKDKVVSRMLPALLLIVALFTSTPAIAKEWSVIPEKSTLTFHGKQMGSSFDGGFDRYPSSISFDPDHLDQSKVSVEVDLASAHTGAADRDENLKGKEWFDIEHFPTAKFETKSFTKTGDGAYDVEGTLNLRGTSIPVKLPLKIVFGKNGVSDSATVDGSITLDRSKFKLGLGQWADTSVIANEVKVDVHLYALSVPEKK